MQKEERFYEKESSKEEFRRSIEEKTLLNYLNKLKVNKGDVFFIKAGTVHAIVIIHYIFRKK